MQVTITDYGPKFTVSIGKAVIHNDLSPALFSIMPARGEAGAQGPQGPQGPEGPAGRDGDNFKVEDTYPTLAALQAAFPTGNEYAYQVTAEDGEIFIWSERLGAWMSIGNLEGPKGDKGDKGDTGKSAYDIAVENGYTGTETQFGTDMANSANNAAVCTQKASDASSAATTATDKASEAATSASSAASAANTAVNNALVNYYNKTQTDNLLAAKANAADVDTSTQVDTKIANATADSVDYSTSGTDRVGVAIGQASTGTASDKKLEVASDYTSVFNGDVEIKQNLDISVEDITDQVTITKTSGRSVTAYTVYKQGDRIYMEISFGTGSSVAAGDLYFDGTVSGCPLPAMPAVQPCAIIAANIIVLSRIRPNGNLQLRVYLSAITSAITVNLFYCSGTIPT